MRQVSRILWLLAGTLALIILLVASSDKKGSDEGTHREVGTIRLQQQPRSLLDADSHKGAPYRNGYNNCTDGSFGAYFSTGLLSAQRFMEFESMDRLVLAWKAGNIHLAEAEKYFQRALSVCEWELCQRSCVQAAVNLGLVQMRQKKHVEAVETMKEALNQYKAGRLMMFYAFFLELAGRFDEAMVGYKEANTMDPELDTEYFGVIRLVFPSDAPREKLIRLMYHGTVEQPIALLDLVIFKEMMPGGVSGYAVVDPEEPVHFWQYRYIVVTQLLPQFVVRAIANCYNSLIATGAIGFKDPQAKRYYAYNERVSRFIHFSLKRVVERVLGREVIASYTYFGGYVGGSTLHPHTDRQACEYTISLLIDHFPLNSTWHLGLGKASRPGVTENFVGSADEPLPTPEGRAEVFLHPGDGLLFMGREKIHYRIDPLPEGHYSRSMFLHYVNTDFKGALA